MNTHVNTVTVTHVAKEAFRLFLELIKFRITSLVSITTASGFILASAELNFTLLYVTFGIFLLAASSSVLNQWQERISDGLMERTRNRPLPSGKIEPNQALYFSFILLVSGSSLLVYTCGVETFIIGIFTFIWYNFIYTPLKKITAFAIIPGALVGALPPLAGWLAAGGEITDPQILVLCLYFFIWQIPHFWLLLMIYSDDYSRGGFPTPGKIFNTEQIKRITFMWLMTCITFAMILSLYIKLNYNASVYIIFLISAWMMYVSVDFFRSRYDLKKIRNTFVNLNYFTLLIITVLSFDKLISIIR